MILHANCIACVPEPMYKHCYAIVQRDELVAYEPGPELQNFSLAEPIESSDAKAARDSRPQAKFVGLARDVTNLLLSGKQFALRKQLHG